MTGEAAQTPVRFTTTQSQRLRELGATDGEVQRVFPDTGARDAGFRAADEALTSAARKRLDDLRAHRRRPPLVDLQDALRGALTDEGFVQVVTPHIISAEALRRMGIEHDHPLREQVFWLEDGRCLRPMLAPNLYTLMRRLGRVWRRPFGIFEVGTCFRRDSRGGRHLAEFTMLNLVEVGVAQTDARPRLDGLAGIVMAAAGIARYDIVNSSSEVYGDMLDIEVGGLEVCSAGLGPHPLDGNWGIVEPWVGLGFGLERLLMARESYATIERAGRSLSYTDGVRLSL